MKRKVASSAAPVSHGSGINRCFGDYEIEGEIACGGMGVVYLARQISLNRAVALKMIRSGRLASPQEVRRFKTEAEAAANLDHPNIVPIYEVGEHEGQHFFSMKLVEGGNLAECNAQYFESRDSREEAGVETEQRWVRQSAARVAVMARAVHHAHQRGVLHRDIKPTNILLDDAGQPHLTDFGLAKLVHAGRDLTQTLAILGTPYYMAPELATGKATEPTTAGDVYSLGAVLYELLAGQPPFQGDTPWAVLRQTQERDPPSLTRLNPSVGRDLEAICLKCLEKDPAQRYPTAEALVDDLVRWDEGKPVEARLAGRVERVRKWVVRNPAIAALAILAHLLLAGGIAGVIWQWQRAESNASKSLAQLQALKTANGVKLLQEGDWFGSLGWFTEALALHQANSENEQDLRLMVGTILRQCPQLEQMWFHEGPVTAATLSPQDDRILTASRDRTARLWDITTGRALIPPLVHRGEVLQARFSPNGRRVLTTCYEGETPLWDLHLGPVHPGEGRGQTSTAHVWDAQTGQSLLPPLVHHDLITDACFSPDEKTFLTASLDGDVCLWNAATGTLAMPPLRHDHPVICARFSPDGSRIVTATTGGASTGPDGISHRGVQTDASVQVWNAATGRPTLSQPITAKDLVYDVEFSPEGRRIVVASRDGKVQVWDAVDGHPISPPVAHEGIARSARFSPDGRWVLSCGGNDFVAKIWDATTGLLVLPTLPHKNVILNADFSRDGKWIVTQGFEGVVGIWDASTGQRASPFLKHIGHVTSAHFDQEGRRLVTAGVDQTVRLWNLHPAARPTLPWLEGEVSVVDSWHHGEILVTQKHSLLLECWETGTWQMAFEPIPEEQRVLKVWMDPERQLLLLLAEEPSDRNLLRISTRKLPSGKEHTSVRIQAVLPEHITAAPDLQRVAIARDDRVEIVDVASGNRLAPSLQHTDPVQRIAYSPDGRYLATACRSDAHLWDATSGLAVGPSMEHPGDVWHLEFSPDGRHLLTSCIGGFAELAAHVWSVPEGRLAVPPLRHADGVRHACFAQDGTLIVTASEDQTARVWSSETGRPIAPSMRHENIVLCAAFSRDQRRVATGCLDGVARVWNVATGEPITPPLPHEGKIDAVEFLAEGNCLMTSSLGTHQFWDLSVASAPTPVLRSMSRLLANQRLDPTGVFEPLDLATTSNLWQSLRARPSPHQVSPIVKRPARPSRMGPAEASIVLGLDQQEDGLRLVYNDDGVTEPALMDGQECHRLKRWPTKGCYAYFALDASRKAHYPRDARVELDYFDGSSGMLFIQYDREDASSEPGSRYASSLESHALQGDRQWKTVSFTLPAARFQNSQNARADFRLAVATQVSEFYVRRVTVSGVSEAD